jgi:hypothetical protein
LFASNTSPIRNSSVDDFALRVIQVVGKQGLAVPSAEMIVTIYTHVYDYFANLCVDEFTLAFDFNVISKYDVCVEHYQSFDIAFISKVLDKYFEFKRTAYQPLKRIFEQANYIDSSKQLAEAKNEVTDTWKILYEEDLGDARNGKFMVSEIRAPFMMQRLLEEGIFKDEMFDDEQWRQWWKNAKAFVRERDEIRPRQMELIKNNPALLKDYKFTCSAQVKRYVYKAFLIKQLEIEQIKIDSDYRERGKIDFSNGLQF